MVKIVVTKEHYDKVRKIERIANSKIKNIYAPVIECVDGQWGLWNIQKCYQSIDCYIAEVELDMKANNEEEAIAFWRTLQDFAEKQMKKAIQM